MPSPTSSASVQVAAIDCDIHNAPATAKTLVAYLPTRWKRHHELFGGRGHTGAYYPRTSPNAARHDSWPPNGAPPGGDLPFMREQLLDHWGFEYGVLNPLLGSGGQLNLEYGAALSSAINDWQIAEWTEPEPRLRASVVPMYEDGALAAAEIDRVGSNRQFVQILLPARTNEPLGRRKYWPMYEAAARHDLPIGIHFGGSGGVPITGAGWPSFYIEDHAGMPTSMQVQVISLVLEGVFERFPTLKVVLIEAGFAWLPPLMWRMDRAWKRLREEVPHLRRLPSEVIRQHFWLTTQPIEEPAKPHQFHELLAQLDMDDRIMFATDYPHWDFDAPDLVFPTKIDPVLERKIMTDNARALYRF
ncbi:MAG: amidohydrolase [Chloroflexi bacterium]|nr:amidohydrolase [Chloroflexota bacterium]